MKEEITRLNEVIELLRLDQSNLLGRKDIMPVQIADHIKGIESAIELIESSKALITDNVDV